MVTALCRLIPCFSPALLTPDRDLAPSLLKNGQTLLSRRRFAQNGRRRNTRDANTAVAGR